MSTAIRFDRVSKRFTLHHQRPRSFQELVIQTFRRNGGASGQHCEVPDGAARERREDFWALRDVSFTVNSGETVGIIGSNGAGKSTVLKLISRIIEPTSGEIEVNGRIGALLELGAGFHPDLSGRENIYLNGSILGLPRREIDCKLDDIISFAELERFIDMPVKHYSSGMRMRLGFSIAAHIDPEILLVDEVLAVGDESFQHKCLDRVMDMHQKGVTICFVSHGLDQVRRLCSRAMWLHSGGIRAEGGVDDVISAYLRCAAEEEESKLTAAVCPIGELGSGESESSPPARLGQAKEIEIKDVSFVDASGRGQHIFQVGNPWEVRVRYRARRRIANPGLTLKIRRNDGVPVSEVSIHSSDLGVPFAEGNGTVLYQVDQLPLLEGTYSLSVSLCDQSDTVTFDDQENLRSFRIRQVGIGERYGLTSLRGRWEWKGQLAPSGIEQASGCTVRSRRSQAARLGSDRRWGTGDVEVVSVSFLDADGEERRVFETGEPWAVRLRYRAQGRVEEPVFGLAVHRDDGLHVCGPNTQFDDLDIPFADGHGEVLYKVDHLPLVEGTYLLSISAHNRMDTVMYDYHDRLYPFKVCQFDSEELDGVMSLCGSWRWTG